MLAAATRTVFARPDSEHVRGQLDVNATMLGSDVTVCSREVAGQPVLVSTVSGHRTDWAATAPVAVLLGTLLTVLARLLSLPDSGVDRDQPLYAAGGQAAPSASTAPCPPTWSHP